MSDRRHIYFRRESSTSRIDIDTFRSLICVGTSLAVMVYGILRFELENWREYHPTRLYLPLKNNILPIFNYRSRCHISLDFDNDDDGSKETYECCHYSNDVVDARDRSFSVHCSDYKATTFTSFNAKIPPLSLRKTNLYSQ